MSVVVYVYLYELHPSIIHYEEQLDSLYKNSYTQSQALKRIWSVLSDLKDMIKPYL